MCSCCSGKCIKTALFYKKKRNFFFNNLFFYFSLVHYICSLLGKEISLRVEILLLILGTSWLRLGYVKSSCYFFYVLLFLAQNLMFCFFFRFFLQKRPFYSQPNAVYLVYRSSGFSTCAMASSTSGTRSSFSTQSVSPNEPVVSVDWLHANIREPDLKVPASCYFYTAVGLKWSGYAYHQVLKLLHYSFSKAQKFLIVQYYI